MKTIARKLRKIKRPPERTLWSCLHNHHVNGYGFRSQQSIGPYVVDFCCFEKRLIIEVNGNAAHTEPCQIRKDQERQRHLEEAGFYVIRFTTKQVLAELEGVLSVISQCLDELPPTLTLSPCGGGHNKG